MKGSVTIGAPPKETICNATVDSLPNFPMAKADPRHGARTRPSGARTLAERHCLLAKAASAAQAKKELGNGAFLNRDLADGSEY